MASAAQCSRLSHNTIHHLLGRQGIRSVYYLIPCTEGLLFDPASRSPKQVLLGTAIHISKKVRTLCREKPKLELKSGGERCNVIVLY